MTTTSEMQTYRGSCHCGRVQFEIRTELTRVSECNCRSASVRVTSITWYRQIDSISFKERKPWRRINSVRVVRSITSVVTAVSRPFTALAPTPQTT